MTEFVGFLRPDGSVGVRNHLVLLGLDPVGMRVCYRVAGLVRGTLPVFTNPGGEMVPQDVVRHPNVAGGVVVGEGIDEETMGSLISHLERTGKPHHVIDIGQRGPVEAISTVSQKAIDVVRDLSTHRRELVRLSKLLPVFLHVPDRLGTKVLSGCVRFIVEEKGRCLWVETGPESRDRMNRDMEQNRAADVEVGQAPGPDPGIYRYVVPERHPGILKTILASGAQIMAFPAGPGWFMAEALIPGVSFVAGEDPAYDQAWDLDLRRMEDRAFTQENAGLLLFSEILATASGKLTRGEIFRDVLIV